MNSIPKIIHCFWFGGGKKPQLIEECFSTWKKYLPEYKIVEWNENNFKVEEFDFVYKAYKDRKWAFVSDYTRLWALYKYGGIYLDTDMEILKPLDDLLNNSSFGGLEDNQIAFGIWGCKKGDRFIGEVLKYYNNLNYDDYKDNLNDLAIPIHLTKVARENGYKEVENKLIYAKEVDDEVNCNNGDVKYFLDNVAIYPKEYFYPKRHAWQEPVITENTYTIHHYEGAWRKPHQILRSKVKEKILKVFRTFKDK